MAELGGHREVIARMIKQLVDGGVPLAEARSQAVAAAKRNHNPRAVKRADFIRTTGA